MEKPIRKVHQKTYKEQDSSNFLVIYTILIVIIAILIASYYKKLKQRLGYLIKNFSLKNLYINLLDDPLENTDELNKKAKKIIYSYGPFIYIQNLNYRILHFSNIKYSFSSFLKEIQSPFSFLKKIEDILKTIDFELPKKINNIQRIKSKSKGKSPRIKKENKNGSNYQINMQKRNRKQRQRLVCSDNVASTSTSIIPPSPVPIFYESFIIQKASTSTTTSSSSTSLVTTVASIASSSTSATTINSKSLSSSRKTLVASTPSITSINNISYKSTSSIVSIVSEKDKKNTYPIKKIQEKKIIEKKIDGINTHEIHTEDILAIATTTSTPSISIPTVPSTLVIQEIKNEEDKKHKEIKSNECPIIDSKNTIKYSQPTASLDAESISSSHSSVVGDDEDTCYDSYISSDGSDNYSTSSELSDSEDDVIILINPEPDLSQFLSPKKNQTKKEIDSNNTNQKTFVKHNKFNKINNEESRKYGQLIHKNYNGMGDKRNSISLSNRKEHTNTTKNNNKIMSNKLSNSSTSSIKTLISHDDLANNTSKKNVSLSPKPITDMILSPFKEPYLVKSIISTASSIQQSPSLSVSSVFSEQSDSSSATLVHPNYSQISTTSTFSTKDTLTESTTELTVQSSAILDKEQGQNVSPNINVNISINNNSSTTTSPLTNNTTTINKSSVFYSSGPMRVSRRNKHYYPSVVSHSRSYGSPSIMQRHMIKPIRRSRYYGGNGSQGYSYYIPPQYFRNSNGMTSPYCPLVYNVATPYIITTAATPNAQGLPVLYPMILYPAQAIATVVSSTPYNQSNYLYIDHAPTYPSKINSSFRYRYGSSYKRFNNNRKRRIYIPYFKKNNSGHHYRNNKSNSNYAYKINNKNLITNSTNKDKDNEVLSNSNTTLIPKDAHDLSKTSVSPVTTINKDEVTEGSIVSSEMKENKENFSNHSNNNNNNKNNNKNNNNKSQQQQFIFSGERRLFKSKKFNNQRIQKKNIFNVYKPTFHKSFKKSPVKPINEYYYQPTIPLQVNQQEQQQNS
ncbi:hypothetical protein BCR36DRAFT_328247 [Piromyces finnis]|uniref:Uncharacterized protein n=1 Tax=Piromyces finnis TaxID=1754191 RepID=A0A1Y1V8N4_9FUNG|nr:hypothetical protein BCR36DRAFT_328247 [Piromyces finnis]|eukprot:ORX49233.1 hypothetical protein BCR36DRAFT_328247 [Piromyces finnis]